MKNKCIAFICFGTVDEGFYNKGLLPFVLEGKECFGDEYDYYMVFSSQRLLNKINQEEINIDVISIEKLCTLKYKDLKVVPLYLINGSEFIKIRDNINENFSGNVIFNSPLLDGKEEGVIKILLDMKEEETGLILIGHGSRGEYNLPYDNLKEKLSKINKDIFFTTLNEEKELKEFLSEYKKRGGKGIKVVPFLMTLGNHFYNDINGTIYKIIEEMDFDIEIVNKSLGMNEEIRRLFLD